MYLPTKAQQAEMARLDRKADLNGRLAVGFMLLAAALWVLYIALKVA